MSSKIFDPMAERLRLGSLRHGRWNDAFGDPAADQIEAGVHAGGPDDAAAVPSWLAVDFALPGLTADAWWGGPSHVRSKAAAAADSASNSAQAFKGAVSFAAGTDTAPAMGLIASQPTTKAPAGSGETLTIGGARTETISQAGGKGFGDFVYEPAFPLPAGDFAVVPSPPTHSIGEGNLDELMDHINRSGNRWDATDPDGGVMLRVAFPQEYDDIPLHFRNLDGFDTPIDAVNAGLDFFNAQKQAYALAALQGWADMANVRFELVDPDEEADIYFYARDFNDGGAFSSGIDAPHGSRIAINVADGWPSMQPGASSFRMLMHEIGHSLGLSHPSDYDVGDYTGYNWDAEYIEDTKMYSIMSYNSGTYTGFDPGGLNPGGITPRTHDAYVIQELYGANWETRDGNSTYGYNAWGVGDLYDFTNYGGPGEFDLPLFTIWDGGGEDWLDLSDDPSSVTLDLRPGAFSSTHGMTYNISIAYVPAGAPGDLAGHIENARGGAGNDTITGNVRDNRLVGNAGNDTLDGREGNDLLSGGAGNDTLAGWTGNDELRGGAGDDVLNGGWGIDWALYNDILAGGVTVDLAKGAQKTGAGGVDTLIAIDNAWGTIDADSLKGSAFANVLMGDGGNDSIWGNGGNDVISGGYGDDQMWGGAGADRFEFLSGWGDDQIHDFQAGTDKLDLTGLTGAEAMLKIGVQSTAFGVMVTCGEQSILLSGVAALQAGDLLF